MQPANDKVAQRLQLPNLFHLHLCAPPAVCLGNEVLVRPESRRVRRRKLLRRRDADGRKSWPSRSAVRRDDGNPVEVGPPAGRGRVALQIAHHVTLATVAAAVQLPRQHRAPVRDPRADLAEDAAEHDARLVLERRSDDRCVRRGRAIAAVADEGPGGTCGGPGGGRSDVGRRRCASCASTRASHRNSCDLQPQAAALTWGVTSSASGGRQQRRRRERCDGGGARASGGVGRVLAENGARECGG